MVKSRSRHSSKGSSFNSSRSGRYPSFDTFASSAASSVDDTVFSDDTSATSYYYPPEDPCRSTCPTSRSKKSDNLEQVAMESINAVRLSAILVGDAVMAFATSQNCNPFESCGQASDAVETPQKDRKKSSSNDRSSKQAKEILNETNDGDNRAETTMCHLPSVDTSVDHHFEYRQESSDTSATEESTIMGDLLEEEEEEEERKALEQNQLVKARASSAASPIPEAVSFGASYPDNAIGNLEQSATTPRLTLFPFFRRCRGGAGIGDQEIDFSKEIGDQRGGSATAKGNPDGRGDDEQGKGTRGRGIVKATESKKKPRGLSKLRSKKGRRGNKSEKSSRTGVAATLAGVDRNRRSSKFAVAASYDETESNAPLLVASGTTDSPTVLTTVSSLPKDRPPSPTLLRAPSGAAEFLPPTEDAVLTSTKKTPLGILRQKSKWTSNGGRKNRMKNVIAPAFDAQDDESLLHEQRAARPSPARSLYSIEAVGEI